MKRLVAWLLNPPDYAPKATILVRLMAGGVFLWEGILKFVYTNQGWAVSPRSAFPLPTPRRSSSAYWKSWEEYSCSQAF